MTVYTGSVCVGSYEIFAIGESPEKCRQALIKEYHRNFGSFSENGFENKAEWLEYHGIADDSEFRAMTLNTAETF